MTAYTAVDDVLSVFTRPWHEESDQEEEEEEEEEAVPVPALRPVPAVEIGMEPDVNPFAAMMAAGAYTRSLFSST